MANTFEIGSTPYTTRQRAGSLALGAAFSIPLTSTMVLAHSPAPMMSFSPTITGATTTFVHHTSTPFHGGPSGVHTPLTTGSNSGTFNLASSQMSFVANNLANFSSLSIDVGGRQEQVGLNTKLTAAEVVAVEQVITGGGAGAQTIKIGANGAADGGSVSLNSGLLTALDNSAGGSISSLTIAKGVQVVDSVSSLSLSGNLSNYGSLLTAAGSSGQTDTISANSIVNAHGASIGSYGGGSGLYSADASLNATSSVSNSGSIGSAGNLSISAPVVTNSASLSGGTGVNISTQNLTNSGNIAALTGNVNLASSSGALNVAGAGGTIQANNGNVNMSTNNADINVVGGNVLSQQLNFAAGTGNVIAQVDQVTGVVNASGNCIHVEGDSTNLNLGAIDATGDPIFTNTGNMNIDNTIVGVAAEPLTLIAGGNIVSAATNAGLVTTGGTGGDITLVAGAVFSQPGGAGAQATVTKASSSGGEIDLTGAGTNPITSVAANGTAGNAGSIQMIAFAGKGAGSGTIDIPSTVTVSATSVGGTAGAITLIAGTKTGTAITAGGFNGASLTIDTAGPTIVPAKGTTGVVFAAGGQQTTGTFGAGAANAANAAVGNVVGTLNVSTGGVVSVTNTANTLDIGTVALGKTGTLDAINTQGTAANGSILVNGVISGGTAVLSTAGLGTVTTGASPASINTTTLDLDAGGGTGGLPLTTNVSNLVLGTGGAADIAQGAATLSLSGASTGAVTVTSTGQVNITAPLFVENKALSITTSGKGGINVGADLQMGAAGTVNLSTTGGTGTDTGKLTESAGVTLPGFAITLSTNEGLGSKTAPFTTDALNSLTVVVNGNKNVSYLNDLNTGKLSYNGSPTTAGGSIFLTSQAATLNVTALNYNTVSITDNVANANGVNFNGGVQYGTGVGTFTVVSASGITETGTGPLAGTTVTLSSSGPGGSVGTSKAAPIDVNSPNLSLTSSLSNVFVSDILAATVNGSASLTGTFYVTDSGTATAKTGDSLTVGKSVGGGTIDLLTTTPAKGAAGSVSLTGTTGTATTGAVNITSAAGLSTKGAVNGAAITLNTASGTTTIGGALGNAVSAITIQSTSASGITISGAVAGNNIGIEALNGPLTVTKAISGTGPNSQVTLEGFSSSATGNADVISGAITGGTINIGLAPTAGNVGNIQINAAVGNTATLSATINDGTVTGGSISGTGLVSGQLVTLTAANSIGTAAKPIETSATTLSANANGTGTAAGAFVTQKGNLSLGNSDDTNLVVTVTGTMDVTGTVIAPSLNLTSTGAFTVDGTIENQPPTSLGSTSGAMKITSGGNFTINGLIQTTNDTNKTGVTVSVKGATTVNGSTGIQTLNLTSSNGYTIAPGAVMSDGTDNLTITGPFVINGQLGNSNQTSVFNISATGNVVIGQLNPNSTIIGAGNIKGGAIINYDTLTGGNSPIVYTGTGTGNAWQNYGTIQGLNITLDTTNPLGIIYNALGATIIASQPALSVGDPTVTLNTYAVNNQGTIGAIGMIGANQGTLNFNSPGALSIQGANTGFLVGAFNAVNITAKGNVTVGGVIGGVTSNPFSNFSAANELGDFKVDTTGTFSSPLMGISVMANAAGGFGGSISIQASNVLYNGTGSLAGPFFLDATGAGPTKSDSAPVSLILTSTAAINITGAPAGSGAIQSYSVNASGFENSAVSTFSTEGVLNINTAPADFNVNHTSLALTGDQRVTITGNLDEGTAAGTTMTITTLSASAFNIGGATASGLGVTGITAGQGISTGTLTIFAPGTVIVGTTTTGAVVTGSQGVTLNSQALTVNNNSDIQGLFVDLNVAMGNTTYTNLNTSTNLIGLISASAVNISDPGGTVTLSNGAGSKNTVMSVGILPNAPAPPGVVFNGGGTFNITAQGLAFTGNLLFNATGGIDGGSVILNLTGGTTGVANTVTIGTNSGQIQANISGTAFDFEPAGSPTFRLNNAGNIVVNMDWGTVNQAINLGSTNAGGNLAFVAEGFGGTTGSTVTVNNIQGIQPLNLFQITSNSTTSLMAQGAGKGGNGITDASVTIFGGNIVFGNSGPVVTNGATLIGTALNLSSNTSIDLSKNSSFLVLPAKTTSGTLGGTINITAPFITVAATGVNLIADGGSLSGGGITVTTFTTPINIGPTGTGTTTSSFSFDVGNMQQGSTGNYVAGAVTVDSPQALVVNGSAGVAGQNAAIVFQDSFIPDAGVGGSLNLSSSTFNPNSANGSNLTITNAAQIVGLNFSTVNLTSGLAGPFDLAATGSGFNGIAASSQFIAGTLAVTAQNVVPNGGPSASINTTNLGGTLWGLTLNSPTITFGANQVITLTPDSKTVGFTGPIGSSPPTGDGGSFTFNTPAFAFTGGTPVTLFAPGNGIANSTGGMVNINYAGAGNLNINANTFLFNVSDAGSAGGSQVAGAITINSSNNGNVVINAAGGVFTYGSTGGSLTVTAPNISVSNLVSLSNTNQDTTGGLGLTNIEFQSTSTLPFQMSNATPVGNVVNGITDSNPALVCGTLTINNQGTGGIDMNISGNVQIQPMNLTLTTPSTITLTGGSTITATQDMASSNQSSPTPGQGGVITITGGAVTINGTGLINFVALGNTATGTGGNVIIDDKGTDDFVINNTSATAYTFNVTNSNAAGAAGVVGVTTGGNISANGDGFTFGANAVVGGSGSIELSGANVLFGGLASLPAKGVELTEFQLQSASASDFSFGGATVNGLSDTGAINFFAFNITIDNNTTGTFLTGINTAGLGAGNTVNLNANTLTLGTENTVTFASGATIMAVANASGAGGNINITAGQLAYTGATGATLTAVGTTSSGGDITVTTTGLTPLNLGTVAAGNNLAFVVTGGAAGTTAGEVTAIASGNIVADCAGFTFGPVETTGSGQLTLTGTNLLVSNVAKLDLGGAFLQTVTFNSTSINNFVTGGATLNGFTDLGASKLVAGGIAINANTAGGLSGGIDMTGTAGGANLTTLAANVINLDTLNTITLPSGGSLQATVNPTSGAGGTITVTAGAIVINGNAGFAFDAPAKAGSGAAGGSVTITDNGTGAIQIGTVGAVTGFTFNVANDGTGNGGTVAVTNGGGIVANCASIGLGATFGTTGPSVTISANGLLALNNVANITTGIVDDTLAFSSDSLQAFALGGAAVGSNGIHDSALSLDGVAVSINNSGGQITMGTGTGVSGSQSLTLTASSDIGPGAAPIVINGATANANISLTAGGVANISVTDTAAVSFLTSTVVGALTITDTLGGGNLTVGGTGTTPSSFNAASITVNYTAIGGNTLTLGTLGSLDGFVNISGSCTNLDVTAASFLSAYSGNLILNNTDVAAGSNINVGAGSQILASGPQGMTNLGNVTIAMGPLNLNGSVPGSVTGTVPAGVDDPINQYIQVYGGAVNFGSTANATGTITVGTTDILQGVGRNLEFSTNTLGAGAITLGDLVFVTADPPGVTGITPNYVPPGATLPVMTGGFAGGVASAVTPVSASAVAASAVAAYTAPSSVSTASTNVVNSIASGSLVSAPTGLSTASTVGPVITSGSLTSGTATVGVNNLSVTTMTTPTSGVSAGFLSSMGSSATVQNSIEETNETAGTSGNAAGFAKAAAKPSNKKLTGGISNNSTRTLDYGPLLIAPQQNEVVETPYGSVAVSAGAVALIVASPKGLAVFNLHDSHKNAVVVSGGGTSVSLVPGRSVLMTRGSVKSFEEVNPAPFIRYRGLVEKAIDSDTKLYHADFDLTSVLGGLDALKKMVSSDNAQTRKTVGNVIKTAAILNQVSLSREQYAYHLPPALTAYAAPAPR